MWWKTCGRISLGRGVMCGLQRLWYTLWQAPHANSQKSTHFQHKAASFIMMIKISAMVWLCSVCCTVLLLCNCCWLVSACTFPEVQVGNPWERRKENSPFPLCSFLRLKPHSWSVTTKVILHPPGENRAVVTFKVKHAQNKACHLLARLELKGFVSSHHHPVSALSDCLAFCSS